MNNRPNKTLIGDAIWFAKVSATLVLFGAAFGIGLEIAGVLFK